MSKIVGVIGSGKFGTTICKLLSENVNVLLFSRRSEIAEAINVKHEHLGLKLSDRIKCTNDIAEVAAKCDVIFPVVPSASFRKMMKSLAPHLEPRHLLIHATKGLDVGNVDLNAVKDGEGRVKPNDVMTMSEVIASESSVVRVGCMSGPNLSAEIMAGEPAA